MREQRDRSAKTQRPRLIEKPQTSPRSFLARIRNYLLTGIIVAAPISITLFIVWQVVNFFDTTAERFIPARYNPETYLPFSLPGLGMLFMVLVLILIGWFAAGFVGRSIMNTGEQILDRMPIVRSLYGTLKQIFETVLAQSSRSFREVVLVEYPRKGIWALGFVTGQARGEIQKSNEEPLLTVFLPTTPNPTSGFLLFVPAKDAIHLDISVEDGIKMVISSGIVTPPSKPDMPVEPNPEPVRSDQLV